MNTFWKGLLILVLGILLGLFVGGYLCLYGGIVQIINGVQADPVNAGAIAGGVIRALCSSVAGGLVAFLVIIPGLELMELREKRERNKRRRFPFS